MKNFRLEFTLLWESLHARVKSAIISILGFFLASFLLIAARALHPNADFSILETIVVTSFSGFFIALVKDMFKV